jgi:hypothetical protein
MRFPFVSLGLAAAVLLAAQSPAEASPMPAYNVVNLGAGTATMPSTDLGFVIAPNGMQYWFPTAKVVSAPNASSLASELPAPTNAPIQASMTYGNPQFAFSNWVPSTAFQTSSGILLVTDAYGVAGHSQGGGSEVDAFQQQVNGTYTPLGTGPLWTSPGTVSPSLQFGTLAQVLAVNGNGSVLGETMVGQQTDYVLYDLKTMTRTDLATLLPNTWNIHAVGLDNGGNVLVTGSQAGTPTVSLLLVNLNQVPEPSALITLVVGLGLAFQAKVRRKSPARSVR